MRKRNQVIFALRTEIKRADITILKSYTYDTWDWLDNHIWGRPVQMAFLEMDLELK